MVSLRFSDAGLFLYTVNYSLFEGHMFCIKNFPKLEHGNSSVDYKDVKELQAELYLVKKGKKKKKLLLSF